MYIHYEYILLLLLVIINTNIFNTYIKYLYINTKYYILIPSILPSSITPL